MFRNNILLSTRSEGYQTQKLHIREATCQETFQLLEQKKVREIHHLSEGTS